MIASTLAEPAVCAEKADTQWFTEAGFGVFIHFGLYSMPPGHGTGHPWDGIGMRSGSASKKKRA